MKGLFEELQRLMGEYRFRPQKKLSQYFLISQPVIEEIVSAAELKDEDIVLEIGCGTGFLTRELLKHSNVVGFEVDEILQQVLENEVRSEKNFRLVRESFLKAELPKFSKIVSAPPYSISSDIMHRLFNEEFELAVLVFESGFVEKISSMPGFRNYCATAVLTQYFFSLEVIGEVSPNAFFPKPKTPSTIIKLVSGKTRGKARNDLLFEEFLKQLFRYKNKNLRNALQHSEEWIKARLKTSNAMLEKFLKDSEITATKVYLIEVEQFVQAFNELCNR